MKLIRIREMLFGVPHKHHNAEEVATASRELKHAARSLSAHLKPYMEADDPLVALMTDVMKKRGNRE